MSIARIPGGARCSACVKSLTASCESRSGVWVHTTEQKWSRRAIHRLRSPYSTRVRFVHVSFNCPSIVVGTTGIDEMKWDSRLDERFALPMTAGCRWRWMTWRWCWRWRAVWLPPPGRRTCPPWSLRWKPPSSKVAAPLLTPHPCTRSPSTRQVLRGSKEQKRRSFRPLLSFAALLEVSSATAHLQAVCCTSLARGGASVTCRRC